MNKILSIIFILSFFINYCYSQECITIDGTSSEKCITSEILESDTLKYKVRIKIHRLCCTKEQVGDSEYSHVRLDNEMVSYNEGEPSLPLVIQHIGLPQGAHYDMSITENAWTEISVGRIYPAQPEGITTFDNHAFTVCDSIYNRDIYLYPMLEGSDIYNWKGVDNFYIRVCPFIYRPMDGVLSVLNDFTLTVVFKNPNKSGAFTSILPKDLDLFDNNHFLTIHENENDRQVSSADSCDYLIIVGNIPEIENSQSMKDFRHWKALKGYRTEVMSTSTIGNDSASIKSYIAQQRQRGVNQVLFVGCNDKIPLVTLGYHSNTSSFLKSDYWYGCLSGANDIQAEIPIGRFLTNSLDAFSNMVRKTIKYESLQHDWANRNLLVSHAETNHFQYVLDSISNTSYNHPLQFYKAYGAPVSQGGLGSNKYDVINYINSGMNLVTINCHGNASGFWMFNGENSSFSYEDRFLLNDDTYPVFLSNACYNGDFTYPPHSIAVYFSSSDHCSTAYVGGTIALYIYPDNVYLQYLYTNLLNAGLYNLGHLVINSHIMNLGYGNLAVDNALSFICAGDPTLELWTGTQNTFENVRFSLINDSLGISVDNADGFRVCLSDTAGHMLGKYSTNGGLLKIPMPTVECDMAINKHDYVPYIIHVNTEDYYIQNVTLSENVIYTNTPVSIGRDVTTSLPEGNVVIQSGADVFVHKGNGVVIKNGFECQSGATFTIE